MSVQASPTPNPNAMKLVVGVPVGGPATVVAGSAPDEQHLADLVDIDGVVSVFFTADFFTISKSSTADWDAILAKAIPILEAAY